MTLSRKLRRFLCDDQSGNATVEFVIVFPVLIGLVGFVFLLAVDFFWTLTSQKAVERGVREAIVRLPVADALVKHGKIITYDLLHDTPGDLTTNYATGTQSGIPCLPDGLCEAVPTMSCTGGAALDTSPAVNCNPQRFTAIYDAVMEMAPGSILPGDLTITYTDSGLGRATESYIPLVTVTLDQSRQLISFRWLQTFFGTTSTGTAPTVTASLVGEHLGN